MKYTLLICFTFLSLTVPGIAEEKKERHLFLLVGQSNMAGRARIEEEDKKPLPGAFLWNIAEGKWEAAVPPYNRYSPSRKSMNMQRLNCGPSFAKAYLEKHPGVEVGIICPARGGTTIEQWEKGSKDQFQLYHHAIKAAKAAAAGGGVWKGILWHQGEGNSGDPSSYPDQLAKLIANFRADLEQPNLPFIYSQLGQWNEKYGTFNEMIVLQPKNIPHTACVLTDDLKPFDEAHFDTSSQRILGQRYASTLEDIANKKPE